jgi:hypothetical protein
MRKLATLAVLGLAISACETSTGPDALDLAGILASQSISDAAHGGAEGFYFLPPMVPNPAFGGTFDPGLEPVVEVCETPDCETLHHRFDMAGRASERVRLDEEAEHYITNWHSGRTGASVGQTYRIRVRAGEAVLGYADVTVVPNGTNAPSPQAGAIMLVAGRTMPIKFRIETGIAATLVVSPSEASVEVGETQAFVATLQDLHGAPLDGYSVTWSSDDEAVATVDETGLATGVSEGEATITATAGLATGSAQLLVTGSAAAAEWQAMGSGMNNTVLALTVYQGELIAGGSFTMAGGQAASRIARWDGSSWQPIGTGMNGTVEALAVYEGELIAGGSFIMAEGQVVNRIARWDGSSWQSLGSGMNSTVHALTVHDGELIAGGRFGSAGGSQALHVARWNGAGWAPLGAGTNGTIYSLTVHDGELIAGGAFTMAEGQVVNRIARWDGSSWNAIGTGANTWVVALESHDNELAAGGRFTTIGGQSALHIARWGEAAWAPVSGGTNHHVHSLSVHDGALIAGGSFTTAGGESAARIALWDGAGWQPLSDGMDDLVLALTSYEGDLVAGGAFSTAGGEPASRIARWGTP